MVSSAPRRHCGSGLASNRTPSFPCFLMVCGKCTCSALSAKCTCRALPSSRKRRKIPRVTSWTRRSGSRPRTYLPMPDKANRHGNPEFTSAGLGPRGIQHARAQDTKLEFADAALHTQKQTVIRAARIVDAVEVDDAGVDVDDTARANDASRGRYGRDGRRQSKRRRRPRRRRARRRASRSPAALRFRWLNGRGRHR